MKRSHWRRGLLAATLGLAVWGGLARGAQPPSQPLPAGPAIPTAPQQFTPDNAPTPISDVVSTDIVEEGGAPRRRFLRFRERGRITAAVKDKMAAVKEKVASCGCYAHHNDYTCGSFHSDLVFMFGSCRQFFGERCLKEPPPPPVDVPGYVRPEGTGKGFGKGYGTNPGLGCNCR